jgi:sugar/nucleoside kinase (ribokinase family)
MKPKIVTVGSVALDSVKTPAGQQKETLGGAATYSSYAAGFFAPVGLVAVVGEDFPEEYIELLKSHKIDLAGLEVRGRTFRWSGSYEGDMNEARTLDTQLNAFAGFDPKLPEDYRDAEIVFLANIHPALQLKVLEQVKKPKLKVMDTMNLWISTERETLLEVVRKVDVLLVNEKEAGMLFGGTPKKAAQEALKMGLKALVVKLGSKGAILFTKKGSFPVPCCPIGKLVDPTGAGDSFAGGFVGWLAKSGDFSEAGLRRAVLYGTVMASFDVQGFSLDFLRTADLGKIEGKVKELEKACL